MVFFGGGFLLFHYHFWTPFVEETEKFYDENGFTVFQRIGKKQGEFQTFNPPLTWDEFRGQNILFRIIELRKGKVNITFGYGKKIMFDHIGFLVTKKEQVEILQKAKILNWEVDMGERRSFITTPYKFRIELQTRTEVLNQDNNRAEIEGIMIETTKTGLEEDLAHLLGKPISFINTVTGKETTIKKVWMKGIASLNKLDPNHVEIINVE